MEALQYKYADINNNVACYDHSDYEDKYAYPGKGRIKWATI